MIHEKFPINLISLNFTNIKSLPSMQQVEMKSKGPSSGSALLSLSSNCAGFMTFAISIRYGYANLLHARNIVRQW